MASGLVVLGCGWIAQRHAAAARRLRLPLVFASRDVARARAFARRYGAVAAYGDYAEAVSDAHADAVIVCTPHDRHLADARLALAAGKHVLVEKPIARTLGETDEMIAAAGAAGRVLMVAEQFHFMPAFRHVHAVVGAGRLGPLRELHLFARGFARRTGWRLDRDRMGGGALIDGGIHYVHNLRWWGGPVRRVYALRPPPTVDTGGEDTVAVLAELASGAVGLVSNSLGSPGLPKFQWSTVTGARASCFADNRGRFVVVSGGGRPSVRWFHRDTRGYETMLTAFRDAIAQGKADEMDGAAGREDLAIVLAAYRSLADRTPVEVPC
jgi:predicted dehydrogenase